MSAKIQLQAVKSLDYVSEPQLQAVNSLDHVRQTQLQAVTVST